MAKKTKIIIYSVIALIICTIIVYPLFTSGEKKTDKGKSTKSDGPAKVKGKILKFDSFASEIKVMGKVIADEWVDLSPEVAGKITKIYFKLLHFALAIELWVGCYWLYECFNIIYLLAN